LQEQKTFEKTINNFKYQFTGTMNLLSSNKNPYRNKAYEIAKENDIPEYAVKNVKILDKNGTVTFKFKWYIEVESDDKKYVIAYIGDLPTEKERTYPDAFVKINGNIYKECLFSYEEFQFDFYIDENTKQLLKEDEIKFIDSLNINFYERYGKALNELFSNYTDTEISDTQIKDFLSLEEVKKFILNEDSESLSDTAPREVLIDLFRDM